MGYALVQIKEGVGLDWEKYISSIIVMTAVATAAAAAKLLQCVRLCHPRDGSPPGSPVPGILQARTLEWVAIAFSFSSCIHVPYNSPI